MQDEGLGSERVDDVCRALPKTIPSYLGSFTFCRQSVMPEAPVSIIARASGRHYPVYRSLYRGFPQPHIRTCHRSNQTLCMLLYIDFSISDIYSENTKGMEPRLTQSVTSASCCSLLISTTTPTPVPATPVGIPTGLKTSHLATSQPKRRPPCWISVCYGFNKVFNKFLWTN